MPKVSEFTLASAAELDDAYLVPVVDPGSVLASANKRLPISELEAWIISILGTAAVEDADAFQPVDSDLTAIAALTTTEFGRSLLTLASATALRELQNLQSVRCRVYSSVAQSAENNISLFLAFNTVRWDSDGHFSIGSPTRLTVQENGHYLIGCNIAHAFVATATRTLIIRLNGTTLISKSSSSSTGVNLGSNTPYDLVAGDYLEFYFYQNTGASLSVTEAEAWLTRLP